jgi:hypothetical protein
MNIIISDMLLTPVKDHHRQDGQFVKPPSHDCQSWITVLVPRGVLEIESNKSGIQINEP